MKTYPISEIFEAPQGEGRYAGTLMTFIRLAGCTVGKPYSREERESMELFPIYQEKCTLYDGRTFMCDTDFRSKAKLTVDEILKEIRPEVSIVCLTGGEPLMHDLAPLVEALEHEQHCVHLETSGTKRIPGIFDWVAVSPKLGFLTEEDFEDDSEGDYEDFLYLISEFKFLVDENFKWESVPEAIVATSPHQIYLQPVNYEHAINFANVKRCLEIQKAHPKVKVSTQLHKILGTR